MNVSPSMQVWASELAKRQNMRRPTNTRPCLKSGKFQKAVRGLVVLQATVSVLLLGINVANAQARVGPDSATRLTRLGRDLAYGTAEGLGFAAVAQLRERPAEWETGWRGYEKRAGSNLGEFYIQEITTEGLAALMNRPVTYPRCPCAKLADRLAWALRAGFTDVSADGSHPIAVPRLVGQYAGSLAQAEWLPRRGQSRTRVAIVNGTTSLVIGAFINIYHELRR